MVKKSVGRKKIEIKKITRLDQLQVAFSKRRTSIINKANEICMLCDAEAAIVVFSPAGKVFTFGHPSVDIVVGRFLSDESPPPEEDVFPFVQAHRNASILELNREHNRLHDQLDEEKKQGKNLKIMNKASEQQFWWNAPIENLSLVELEKLQMSLEEVKRSAVKPTDGASTSFMEVGGMVDPFIMETNGTNASRLPQGFGFGYEFSQY